MATDKDASESTYPTRLTSEPLEAVRHLRVSDNNPETSTNDGLDYERCSALHNAIVKHAWQAEGYDLADLPTTTWWQRSDYAPRLSEVQKHLPESLVEFLKRALSPAADELPDSSRYYFFYFAQCLSPPDSLWSDSMWFQVGEEEVEMGGIERIALYLTDTFTSDETIDGILYDYDTHACVFNSWPYYMFTEDDSSPIWQRLETILTAWIEMIERRKVAVVHKDLGKDSDLVSGVHLDSKNPWGWAPWTQADLEDTLEAWNDLISSINDRLPQPRPEPLSRTSLFEVDDLHAAEIDEGSFAWEFYRKACKPHFRYLAPGLQLPSREQLLSLPFEPAWEGQKPTRIKMRGYGGDLDIFPLPILLSTQLAKSWVDRYQYEVGPVNCGLYLDILDSRTPLFHPYEDAARLVLPYELDASTSARRLDGKPALGNAELYQTGQNPFERNGTVTQLWQLLKHFAGHVYAGEWKVDVDGVSEPATVFDNFFVHGVEPDGDEADNSRYAVLKNMYL